MDKALVVIGPTASGKSALALDIAKQIRCEIISLDSALIYKDMDIGTAKPTPEELSSVPHHLVSIIDPKDSYSAARFAEDCTRLVGEITRRGALPVICGGTMMYYKALVEGLSPLPSTVPEVRERILAEGQLHGWPYMHEKLRDIDPQSYARLSPNDKQRVSRALEVFAMTGRPLSSYFAEKGDKCPFARKVAVLLPEEDRIELRKVIRLRFEQMMAAGLIDEVKKLKERGDLSLALPSMRCVGYRQVWEYLDGLHTYEETVELSVIATARLAKHQMTWMRKLVSDESEKDRLVLKPYAEENLTKLREFIDSPWLNG